MAKKLRHRGQPAWKGKRRGGDSLRERRPYKTRTQLQAGKTRWYLRVDKVFFWSGEWRHLTILARAVLEVLRQLADGDNPYRWLHISDRDLMYWTGKTRRAVHDAICDLQDHGCIEGERGGRRPGRYRLTDKVQSFAHGTRQQRTATPTLPPTPTPTTTAPPSTPAPGPDTNQELPPTLAAVITPFQWQRICSDNSPDQIRHAVMAYSSEAGKHPIDKPLALFSFLLRQDWTAARAIELQDEERRSAALEERARNDRDTARRAKDEADARSARRQRPFTQAELQTHSETALAKVHRNDFARKNLKVGGTAWKAEMWGLIEEKAAAPSHQAPNTDTAQISQSASVAAEITIEGTEAPTGTAPQPQDSPEATPHDSTPNGPTVAAEAAHTTRGGPKQ